MVGLDQSLCTDRRSADLGLNPLTPSPSPPPEVAPWGWASSWPPSDSLLAEELVSSSYSPSPPSFSVWSDSSDELEELEGFEHLKSFEAPRFDPGPSLVGENVIGGKWLSMDLLLGS